MALERVSEIRGIINETLKNEDKATLVLKAVLITWAASKLNEVVYHHDKHFTDRVRSWFFQFVRSLPVVGDKIQDQVDEAKASVRNQKSLYNPKYIMQLPDEPSTVDQMMEKVEFYLKVSFYFTIHLKIIKRWIRYRGRKVRSKEPCTTSTRKLSRSVPRHTKCSCGQIHYMLMCSREFAKWRQK